jgi:hypothetical protein
MAITGRDQLIDVFRETARRHASDRGYSIDDSTELTIRRFCQRGAGQIFAKAQRPGLTINHPQIARDITDAEHHIKQFVDQMIQNKITAGGSSTVLDDSDFQSASQLLCPAWPFCVDNT